MNKQKPTHNGSATDHKLPNFLIVGAAKSGTTSLYHYLKDHPEVFMPEWKEPSFFAPPDAGGITRESEYKKLFSGADNHKAVGEASVAYLCVLDAALNIRGFLGPDIKIIIILRNPVDMAYSNWGHQVRLGGEDLSFKRALEKEPQRMSSTDWQPPIGWKGNFAYRARATYSPQIAKYIKEFPEEQIRIYLYEEFFAAGLPQWEDLCKFLKITPDWRPEEKIFNPSGKTRFHVLHKILNQEYAWKNAIKKIILPEWRIKLKTALNKLNRKSSPLAPLPEDLRKELENDFSPEVRTLEKMLGRKLDNIWF